MTELPPIIERLDALRPPKGEGLGYYKALEQWEHSVGESYDDLRAELLRLQEARDTEREWGKAMQQAAGELEKERDALLEALKARSDCADEQCRKICANCFTRRDQAIASVEGKNG